jgi:hypothetical protein
LQPESRTNSYYRATGSSRFGLFHVSGPSVKLVNMRWHVQPLAMRGSRHRLCRQRPLGAAESAASSPANSASSGERSGTGKMLGGHKPRLATVRLQHARQSRPHLGLQNGRVQRCPPPEALRFAQCKGGSFATSVRPHPFSSYPLRLGLTSLARPNRQVCGRRSSVPGAACLPVPGRRPG